MMAMSRLKKKLKSGAVENAAAVWLQKINVPVQVNVGQIPELWWFEKYIERGMQ